jgi:hypothetical protein
VAFVHFGLSRQRTRVRSEIILPKQRDIRRILKLFRQRLHTREAVRAFD